MQEIMDALVAVGTIAAFGGVFVLLFGVVALMLNLLDHKDER